LYHLSKCYYAHLAFNWKITETRWAVKQLREKKWLKRVETSFLQQIIAVPWQNLGTKQKDYTLCTPLCNLLWKKLKETNQAPTNLWRSFLQMYHTTQASICIRKWLWMLLKGACLSLVPTRNVILRIFESPACNSQMLPDNHILEQRQLYTEKKKLNNDAVKLCHEDD
jgi:hypothetical protein